MLVQSPLIAKQRALAGGHPLQSYGSLGHVARLTGRSLHARPAGFGNFGVTIPSNQYSSTARQSVSGAASGAAMGASIGSVVPILGTAIGAIGGAIGGAIAGALSGRRDPEQANFDQAVALWQRDRLAVLGIADKYLFFAGLFDLNLRGPHIPIYQRYGRMGEEKFVHDLAMQVYNAAQSGQITPSDTPQTIMVKVVQPWIDSWGFGPMSDPHQDLINIMIMGLIADYVAGVGPNAWRARSGDLPASFRSIPPFALATPQGAAVPSVAAQYAPTTAVVSAPVARVTQIPPTTVVTAPVTTVPTTAPVTPTTVAVPAGFTLLGIANGLQAYQGLDGLVYSWNGATMSPLTGTLTGSGGMSVYVANGVPQTTSNTAASSSYPSLSAAGQQSYNTGYPASYDTGASSSYAPAQPAAQPATQAVLTGGYSGWIGWVAVAGLAGMFFFSTRGKQALKGTAT